MAWALATVLVVLAFWLLIMLLIWLHLLDVAHVVTGRFPPAEIALKVGIGLACGVGLVATTRIPAPLAWWRSLAACVLCAALQAAAMWLSLRTAFADR